MITLQQHILTKVRLPIWIRTNINKQNSGKQHFIYLSLQLWIITTKKQEYKTRSLWLWPYGLGLGLTLGVGIEFWDSESPVQIGRLQMYRIIKKQIRDKRVYYRNKTFLSIAKCHLLSSLHQAYMSWDVHDNPSLFQDLIWVRYTGSTHGITKGLILK